MYDLVVLAVAVAFFAALRAGTGLSHQRDGLGVAGTLILIFPYVKTQVGLAAVSIVLALVIGRARTVARFTPQAP